MARSIIKYLYLITPFLTALLILSCSGRKDGIPQQKQPPSVASEELRTDSFKYSLENEYGLDRGYGFTAIIVAWLAKFNPLMMVLTSFLIVFLDKAFYHYTVVEGSDPRYSGGSC